MPVRQAEGNVACPEVDVDPEFLADRLNRLQGDQTGRGVGPDAEDQRVDDHILHGNPELCRPFQDPRGHPGPILRILGDATFVHGQPDHRRAPLAHERQHRGERFLLAGDRVHQRLARGHLKGSLEGRRIGGIQAEGNIHSRSNLLHHLGQETLLVDPGHAHIHVEHLGACLHLRAGEFTHKPKIPCDQGRRQLLPSGGIDLLANNHDLPFRIDGYLRIAPLQHRSHGCLLPSNPCVVRLGPATVGGVIALAGALSPGPLANLPGLSSCMAM